ncbi:MAG: type II secretion system F family protein [Candidatus Sumerlaeota bacterium]|nr:type II secretion system F family protein [Candidatus Sumerlaeota bacterium]
MPEYSYLALDRGGKQIKGVIDAPNEDAIIEKLRGMGYYPIEVALNKKKAGDIDLLAMPGLRNIFGRVKRKHLTTFTRQLATLIDAGLPILRSLRILEEQSESPVFKVKIRQIAEDIEGGSSLAEAFARHPKVFDNLYVSMVRAGELGGVLEAVLNKVAEFLEKRAALVSKVRSALMYPLAVMVIATCIVTFILTYILPKFEDMFAQLGADRLPGPTEFLVKVSYALVHQLHLILLAVVAFVAIYSRINKTREGKHVIDRIKLKLPIFGELLRKVAIVRFAETLATLIHAGVPILHSLDIVRDTSGNEVVARAMDDVYESVKDGETIHEPLAESKVFPPLVVHMVAVGEETGAIDQMLNKVAEAYTREVDDTVEGLTSILEPMMIVVLGVIVGGIVICLYLPLFEIGQHIK